MIDGKRIAGPTSNTRAEAKKKLNLKLANRKAAPTDSLPTLADEIYRRLAGPWKRELARATWQLYHDAFKLVIEPDPIGNLEPLEITTRDLEDWRERLLPGRHPRTVQAYMRPGLKVLRQMGNNAAEGLGRLKMPPIHKKLLDRKDKAVFLALMPTDRLKLACELFLHGLTVAEACAFRAESFDGKSLRIHEQKIEVDGKTHITDQLKRPRRYRLVPASKELRSSLIGRSGFVLGNYKPNNVRRDMRKALAGTRFAGIGPHDLRSTGGKWMLDAGAKLSDVASILGNDPRVLLLHYDQADVKGKERAIKRALG